MIKYIFAFLLGLFLLPLTLLANSDASNAFECHGALPTQALSNELSQVQNTYLKVNSIRAVFEQDSYLAALDKAELSQGRVIFKKPGKMQWDYTYPEVQTFTLKDNTAWFYQPEVKQVVIDDLSNVVLSDLPVSFLMGIGDLNRDFSPASGCKSVLGTIIELKPKGSKKANGELKNFKLLVGSKNSLPIGAKVTDVAGNVTTILLKAIDQNVAVSEDLFTANYPQGTDLIDRRKNG